ncbi:hypothetical protein [Bosea sp. (in: a-proteobacteria)]|uniref:hypothetical protein n=1 Tax=Bosea sp. (in: a-proteobacteria) TaxID=1871050 RepID=UPI0027342870|nr:hypothetical protein [Bosea sp. (in: a-proteobacteria)]MDP3408062.1 hypothetical protein [Bosea sp. (in: a-proteobacteria)]
MGRARGSENNTDLAYEKPNPIKVYEISRDYGAEAAAARWFWLTPKAVQKIAQQGHEMTRGVTGERKAGPRRKTNPEQEDAIIAAATAAGKVHGIGVPFGVSDSLVRTLFRERGLEYPKTDYAVRAARGKATRRERNAAFPAQTRTLIPYIGQEGSNVVSMPISIRGHALPSVAAAKPATVTSDPSKGTWGMERKVPADGVIRADHAAGMTPSEMCRQYGVKGMDYHLKRLGLSKSRPVVTQPAPVVAPAHVEATPAPAPVAPTVAQRPAPAPLPEVEDLDLMILAARIVSAAGCDAPTAISIVRSWRS